MEKKAKKSKKAKQSQEPMQEGKRKIPFWLQIVVIFLCGVVLSGVAYFVVQNKIEADREAKKPRYTVTFAYQDSTVIDTKQVKEGTGTFPPKFETDGVFQGWNSNINEVQSDTEVHPIVYDIVEDENLFCFDAVYAQEGSQFTIDLELAGRVYISSAELSLEYDAEVMDYIKSSDMADCTVTKETDGKLRIALRSEKPLTEDTLLSSITFLAKPKNVYSSQIMLNCISGTLSNDGEETTVTVTTINNTIYYLQEVSR